MANSVLVLDHQSLLMVSRRRSPVPGWPSAWSRAGTSSKCNLLLVGDGTLNAVATQKPEILRMPSNMEALQDMTEMEFKVYCVKQDLDERAPGASVLNFVEMVDWEKARKIIDEHQMVTTF